VRCGHLGEITDQSCHSHLSGSSLVPFPGEKGLLEPAYDRDLSGRLTGDGIYILAEFLITYWRI
jgi:hypothetical protein